MNLATLLLVIGIILVVIVGGLILYKEYEKRVMIAETLVHNTCLVSYGTNDSHFWKIENDNIIGFCHYPDNTSIKLVMDMQYWDW